MMMRAAALVGLAALAGCAVPGPTSVGPVPLIPDAVYTVVGTADLPPVAQAELATFRAENQAFGAIYFSEDGFTWAWRVGTFSLVEAEREARTACNTLSSQPCALYATITPSDPRIVSAVPMRAAEVITDAYNRTMAGNYASIFRMPIGAYGFSYNYQTSEEAIKAAREECESEEANERAMLDPSLVQAYDRAGLFDCIPFVTYQR